PKGQRTGCERALRYIPMPRQIAITSLSSWWRRRRPRTCPSRTARVRERAWPERERAAALSKGEPHHVEPLGIRHADHAALEVRELSVHLRIKAAAAELARVRGDRVHLRVDRVRDIDVCARMERHRHGIAIRRVV